jgi:hypothetical protein
MDKFVSLGSILRIGGLGIIGIAVVLWFGMYSQHIPNPISNALSCLFISSPLCDQMLQGGHYSPWMVWLGAIVAFGGHAMHNVAKNKLKGP